MEPMFNGLNGIDFLNLPDEDFLDGLEAMTDQEAVEFVSYVNGLDAVRRAAAQKKIVRGARNASRRASVGTRPAGRGNRAGAVYSESGSYISSHEAFVKMLSAQKIDPSLLAAYQAGTLRIIDQTLFGNRLIGTGLTSDLIQLGDNEKNGVTNLNGAKLQKGQLFCVTGIGLLAGVGTSTTNEGIDVAYDVIPGKMRNGHYTFKGNDQELIKKSSCEDFYTTGNNNLSAGIKKLDSPILLNSEKQIEFEIAFASAHTSSYLYAKWLLKGAWLAK